MLRKLTKLVTNNFGLKVLGAVLAVILWMVIVNVEDPDKFETFSLPVQITNEDYLTEIGKTFEVLENTDTISVVVSGPRSVMESLDVSDFTATANMENIDASMTMIPITVTANSYGNQLNITQRTSFVIVNVENLVTETFRVEVETEGELAEGCFVDEVRSSVRSVTVSGPESVVNRVAAAQVTLDVSGAAQDTASVQPIVLVDADGNEISQERLTLGQTEVTATARIQMRKNVQLDFDVTGEPAEGYRYTELSSDVTSVELEGDPEILSVMEELQISASELDISGVTSSVTAVIRLDEYLPEDVVLADEEPEEITVMITIEAQSTIDVEVPVENVTVNNLADGLELRFNSETVIMHISGYQEELSQIDGRDLTGTMDVSGRQTGTYNVEVRLNGAYADASSGSVSVTITSRENSQTGESNTTNTGGLEE